MDRKLLTVTLAFCTPALLAIPAAADGTRSGTVYEHERRVDRTDPDYPRWTDESRGRFRGQVDSDTEGRGMDEAPNEYGRSGNESTDWRGPAGPESDLSTQRGERWRDTDRDEDVD